MDCSLQKTTLTSLVCRFHCVQSSLTIRRMQTHTAFMTTRSRYSLCWMSSATVGSSRGSGSVWGWCGRILIQLDVKSLMQLVPTLLGLVSGSLASSNSFLSVLLLCQNCLSTQEVEILTLLCLLFSSKWVSFRCEVYWWRQSLGPR